MSLPKPYYKDPDCDITIYCGDCLEIMKEFPDKSFDLVITSPPYNKCAKNKSFGNWQGAKINYDEYSDDKNEEEYQEWQVKVLNYLSSLIKDTGSIFYNHKNRRINGLIISPLDWIKKSNLKLRQEIFWLRGGSPDISPIKFMTNTEIIFHLTNFKNKVYFDKYGFVFGEVWNFNQDMNNNHPAPFPKELPNRCILTCSQSNNLILDPFMGSGTTLVAAKELKRRAVGIEISEKYCEIAVKRLKNTIVPMF